MNIIAIDSSVSSEAAHHQQTVRLSLVKNRSRRVISTEEESLALIDKLSGEFSGRDLATALMAEGFGTAREVREAVYALSGRPA